MAQTYAVSGLPPQQWDSEFFTDYVRSSRFKRYMGTDEGSIIQLKEDLAKKKGDSLSKMMRDIEKVGGSLTAGNVVNNPNIKLADVATLRDQLVAKAEEQARAEQDKVVAQVAGATQPTGRPAPPPREGPMDDAPPPAPPEPGPSPPRSPRRPRGGGASDPGGAFPGARARKLRHQRPLRDIADRDHRSAGPGRRTAASRRGDSVDAVGGRLHELHHPRPPAAGHVVVERDDAAVGDR